MQGHAVLDRREAVDGTLARRALVLVILGDVDEVRLVEATLCLGIGGHRLGHHRRDVGLGARLDLGSAEVAAVGHGL